MKRPIIVSRFPVFEKDNSKDLLDSQTLELPASDDNATLRVLQITDCHLGEAIGEVLAGMDTDASLASVLELLVAEQSEHGEINAELLLATGDLSNLGTASAYYRLEKILQPLGLPMAWLPGNHDVRDLMIDSVGIDRMPRLVRLGRWAICMLDSAVPGQVGGELGATELNELRIELDSLPADVHIMICLHHQPVEVGSAWLDQQKVADADRLFALLKNERRVKAILWGHVHQEFYGTHPGLPGVKLIASPSTCIQFAPGQRDFKLDTAMPGYRWLDLHADGSIQTGVSRVEGADLRIDLASSGY
ncbi:MAG: 3',5'-cyclic-AMP phosphodiesterase [Pseudomonadales bacterium]|nr:3',5'-cyclic-AMP phosphodiesterase [Pseudomonadales bacterium]